MHKEIFYPNSALIKEIEYSYLFKEIEPEKKICERMTVRFHSGVNLEYSGFDLESIYKKESAGKFWHKNIKDKFECKKISC